MMMKSGGSELHSVMTGKGGKKGGKRGKPELPLLHDDDPEDPLKDALDKAKEQRRFSLPP